MSIKLGLERIQKLLQLLGNPQDSLTVVHVAGTNGKGSVCSYMGSALIEAGYSVGVYNSPHLLHPTDSIRVNAQPVSQEVYFQVRQRIIQLIDQEYYSHDETPSSFEILTATAITIFKLMKVDIAVIEVGMGGRLDATNIFKPQNVLLSVITCIGIDHLDMLGGDIQSIARHKAGIIKQGVPVIVGKQNQEYEGIVHRVVIDECEVVTSQAYFDQCDDQTDVGSSATQLLNQITDIDGYQRQNAFCAIRALLLLGEQLKAISLKAISHQQLLDGIQKAAWPGRLTFIDHPSYGKIILDGAHNPDGCTMLSKYLQKLFGNSPKYYIIGVSAGKQVVEMLKSLDIGGIDQVSFVPFSQPEDMPWVHCTSASDIQREALSLSIHGEAHNNLQDAFASHPGMPIVCCGSLYLIADVYRFLMITPTWRK
ncbi:hypothetical protein MIR68_000596 [Amoeboaphelidium protococcarum]|nr:hypothetical protein MIR68_000596 [Amoeboaphelidium protococcarum]